MIGSIRQLGVVLPSKEGLITEYYGWIGLRLTGGIMQMHVLEPPNVAATGEKARQYLGAR